MILKVASFLPFQTTYYINGPRLSVSRDEPSQHALFRRKVIAFLAINNPDALQKAPDRFTPELWQDRFDYWTFGPKFSKRERKAIDLHRFYPSDKLNIV